jgi:hypothetical protein
VRELRRGHKNQVTRLLRKLLRIAAVAASHNARHEYRRTSGGLLHRQLLAPAYENAVEQSGNKFEAALMLNQMKISENALQLSQRS